MPRGKPNQRYTPEFKKLVIETMCTEHLGCLETAARFNIRHKRIQDWEQIYLEERSDGFDVERRGHGCKNRAKKLTAEDDPEFMVPFGKADIKREGTDVTIVTNLLYVSRALQAADEVAIKSMCALCLSYDHRIIDGAEAAKFLQKVKTYLQNPVLLI